MLRRDVHGWTVSELADDVGISRSYLEKIESGRRDPSVGICARAARALGVPLKGLIDNGATGGDGVVLETVARLRGLGVDPGALSAWLARRPCPMPVTGFTMPREKEPAPSPDQEMDMCSAPDKEDEAARQRKRKRARISMVVARRISRLRRAMRPILTQAALAARIGASRAYVTKLEKGEVDLPLSLAVRIASVLRVPMAKLIVDHERDDEAEEWHRVALDVCRVFSGMGMKPEEAAPSIRWLTSLLASYVRKGSRRK